MRTIVVIGAGLGGLAAALFLARRGVRVVLIEKDGTDPPGPRADCFEPWSRRGVVQMRQPHVLWGRGSGVLAREAPDVLEALKTRGARLLTSEGRSRGGSADHPFAICARRPLLEAGLRRAAEGEPGLVFMKGCEAVGLLADPRCAEGPPRVRGVRLADGTALEADLVVDAAGRFAPTARWLGAVGAHPVAETAQTLEFHTVTRWYRSGPGRRAPSAPLQRADAGYAVFSAFAGDHDTFALSVMVSLRDRRRSALRDPAAFDRVVRASRLLGRWAQGARPVGEPLVLSRVENRSVHLIREGRPVVRGLVLLGDAAVHVTPTLGYGGAMALAMAERLSHQVGGACVSDAGFVAEFEAWRAREIAPWFEAQVEADGRTLHGMRRSLARLPQPAPSGRDLFWRAAELEARSDETLASALDGLRHMLVTPEAVARTPLVQAAVARRLRRRAPAPAGLSEITRAEFEEALEGAPAADGIRIAV